MVQPRTDTETFKNRLPKEAVPHEEVADNLPPASSDRQLRQRKQAETASNINKWLGSKICGKAC
jgi:hypothetical protein